MAHPFERAYGGKVVMSDPQYFINKNILPYMKFGETRSDLRLALMNVFIGCKHIRGNIENVRTMLARNNYVCTIRKHTKIVRAKVLLLLLFLAESSLFDGIIYYVPTQHYFTTESLFSRMIM